MVVVSLCPARLTSSALQLTSPYSTACLGVSWGCLWKGQAPSSPLKVKTPAPGPSCTCAAPPPPCVLSRPDFEPARPFPPPPPPAGYSFYSHLVSCRMLPLRRLVRWTNTAHAQLGFPPGDQRALFAASHK